MIRVIAFVVWMLAVSGLALAAVLITERVVG